MFARMTWNHPVDHFGFTQLVRTRSMFDTNTAFNQPVGSWDMSTVKYTPNMFYGATSFNKDL